MWTRDERGNRFHYDIRVCLVRSRKAFRLEFLVLFDHTGLQGNTVRYYSRMNRAQVERLPRESA